MPRAVADKSGQRLRNIDRPPFQFGVVQADIVAGKQRHKKHTDQGAKDNKSRYEI